MPARGWLHTPLTHHVTDAHPYATLRKNLKAKRGTVHTSYLYEALATFVETGTTLLPPAATLIPGVGLATAPFSTSQNSSASGRRSADDGAAEPQDNLAQRATTTPPTSLLQAANNVVAAPHLTSNPHPHGSIIPVDYRDGDGSDPRPILLFDLNGTITSHTVKRRSSGINKPRPGIPHLRRLQVRAQRDEDGDRCGGVDHGLHSRTFGWVCLRAAPGARCKPRWPCWRRPLGPGAPSLPSRASSSTEATRCRCPRTT